MYVRRNIRWNIVWKFSWRNIVIFTLWAIAVTALYIFLSKSAIDISIPFLPLSTIGIAVAFYIGFKNSQSYDRFWEGRKIWGGIVNYSRTWANQVLNYTEDTTMVDESASNVVSSLHYELIFRHLAWINSLRIQLRQTTILDRKNLSYVPDLKLKNDRECQDYIRTFLKDEEYIEVMQKANTATHLVRNQGEALQQLAAEDKLDTFRHVNMMQTLEELYNLQGNASELKTLLSRVNMLSSVQFSFGFSFFYYLLDWSVNLVR